MKYSKFLWSVQTLNLNFVLSNKYVRIEDDGLGFYFILFSFYFLLFLLKSRRQRRWKCDTVTEVTHSCDIRKQCRRFWKNDIITTYVSRSLMVNFIFIFSFHFILFFFFFFFSFLFLEQLGLGFICHTVTSVTSWWCSHKTDHRTWENRVEGSEIKWRHTT